MPSGTSIIPPINPNMSELEDSSITPKPPSTRSVPPPPPPKETISDVELQQIKSLQNELKVLQLEAQNAALKLETGKLKVQYQILSIYHKYHMNEQDSIDPDLGTILRK